MVKNAPNSSASSSHYTPPISSRNMLYRKIYSVILMILLWTAATPFSPISWVVPLEGGALADRFLAGIILLSALYFQWRIGTLTSALAISIGPSSTGYSSVRNGRMEKGPSLDWVYHPGDFWSAAVCETLLLLVAELGGSEYVRRAVVVGVVAALWAVGWSATPEGLKRWAWDHIKALWFWIALDEVMNVGRRGGYARNTRGRRAW